MCDVLNALVSRAPAPGRASRPPAPAVKQLRARVEGSRWRPSSFGWSPLRWFWPRTKVLRVPASTASKRAHYRYEFAPARRPVARPEPAQRTAGALPVYLPELRLLAWVVSAAKTPLGVAAPPITTTAKSCPLQHPPGSFKFQPNPSFIR
eukprot:scaffold4490_cov130-Isochrysis_galbana.AAC.4